MEENQPPTEPVVTSAAPSPSRRQITIPGFWQTATLLLLIALVVAVFMWKPWEPNIKAGERTIAVTGSATISATPDEYKFSPYYRLTAASKEAAVKALTSKSNEITKQLKSLGVSDNDIKTNSNGYDYYYATANGNTTYNLNIDITVNEAKLAQKVQDYLLTTSPTGTITPYVSFSKEKEQQLQDKARNKAEENARKQADQSAKTLGFKVGSVKSVKDGDLGSIRPFYNDIAVGASAARNESSAPHLQLQPGQNDLSYSVRVVYYIH
jgi:uncharacterized protein YggE